MNGPLDGIKVLSFGRMLSGPYAGMLLSDLGAEVIKIEVPRLGDLARFANPAVKEISSYFLSINRGKKSITLDLKKELARDIIFKLLEEMDVLLENFRPGVMKKLGLDYDAVKKKHPGIVYASISGFGQTGPYAQRPAFDMIAQGMGGVVSITGEPGRPPARVGYSIGDMGASLFASTAILAALLERQKSGKGQWIDVSMLDCQVALGENACARHFATGEVPRPYGSRHPLFTPFQAFPTKNGHIILIIMKDEEWKTFCRITGRESWITDPRFNSLEARLENYDRFVVEMNRVMQIKTTREWMTLLDKHHLMCGPVNTIEEVVHDPHIQERGMFVDVTHRSAGKLKVVGTPMKFSRTPCKIETASPELGEHTDEILSDLLNMPDEEIEKLRHKDVV